MNVVEKYFETWNETDPERRTALAGPVEDGDGRFAALQGFSGTTPEAQDGTDG